jgi:uncharacterized membrane protein
MLPHERELARATSPELDVDLLVGYLLLGGVLVSVTLILAGLTWQWSAAGHLQLEHALTGENLFRLALTDARQIASGPSGPRLLINTGIITLMLTPYVRVLASVMYFALAEHNRKYTVFTGFVLAVLTYSLFLR